MRMVVSDTFFPLFAARQRFLMLRGGAGSGKSEFAARKLFRRCMEEGGHRLLCMRKVRKTLRESVVKVFTTLLEENKVDYEHNKSDRIITFSNPAGRRSELLFDGMDDWQKIKSIKGVTGAWLEETTEFAEEEFQHVNLYLREPTPHYKQIICTYNPDERQARWLKEMEAAKARDRRFLWHHSTVEDNPIESVRREYTEELDAIGDETLTDIYRYGLWALPKGLIFDWPEVDLPEGAFDEIIYGGDFGYSVNQAALVRIYRKALDFWVEDILYETGLTNPALAARIRAEPGVDPRAPSYWDSAEPKSIQELCDNGVNALPCDKFQGSLEAMIKVGQALNIRVVRGSSHLPEELRTYKRVTDKDGKPTGPPVNWKNHAIMAALYGVCTHYWKYLRPGRKRGKVVTWRVRRAVSADAAKPEGGPQQPPPDGRQGPQPDRRPAPAAAETEESYGRRRKGRVHFIR